MIINLNPLLLCAWAAGVLFAVGYLVATYRRSRRVALIGLLGVVLLGLFVTENVHMVYGVNHYEQVLRWVGFTIHNEAIAEFWTRSAHRALAYGLLIWAVLADRPPPADGE